MKHTYSHARKPEGEYLAVITSVQLWEHMWVIGFTLRNDPNAVYPVEFRKACDWRMKDLLRTCGISVTKGSEFTRSAGSLLGYEVGVIIEDVEGGRSGVSSFFPSREHDYNQGVFVYDAPECEYDS